MSRRWITLPNFITLLRVFLVPPVIIALKDQDYLWLTLLGIAIFLSDFLDGMIARWLNQVSDIGKILDPIADKICVFTLFPAVWWYTDFPFWALSVLILKDLLIALGGAFISRRQKIPITPNFWGKAAVFMEFFVFMVFAYDLDFLKQDFLWVMIFFVVMSFISYISIFHQVLSGRVQIADITAGYTAYGLRRTTSGSERRMNALIILLIFLLFFRLAWLLYQNI